jgi:hypothetical protein
VRVRPAVPVALTVLLAVGVAAMIFEIGKIRDERDSARSELAAAQRSLIVTTEPLDVATECVIRTSARLPSFDGPSMGCR